MNNGQFSPNIFKTPSVVVGKSVVALDIIGAESTILHEMLSSHVIPNSRVKRYEKDLKARILPRIHLEDDVYLPNFLF